MRALPPELLLAGVVSRLGPRDTLRLAGTCRALRTLVLSAATPLRLRALRVPATALPDRATSALLLPHLARLTITGGSGADGQLGGGGGGSVSDLEAAAAVHVWVADAVQPLPVSDTEGGEESGEDEEAAARPSCPHGADGGEPPDVALSAPCLRELRLALDLPAAASVLLLHLCPNLQALAGRCLMAGAHAHVRRRRGHHNHQNQRHDQRSSSSDGGGGGVCLVEAHGGRQQQQQHERFAANGTPGEGPVGNVATRNRHDAHATTGCRVDGACQDRSAPSRAATDGVKNEAEEQEQEDEEEEQEEEDHEEALHLQLFEQLAAGPASLALACPHCLDAFFTAARAHGLPLGGSLVALAAAPHPSVDVDADALAPPPSATAATAALMCALAKARSLGAPPPRCTQQPFQQQQQMEAGRQQPQLHEAQGHWQAPAANFAGACGQLPCPPPTPTPRSGAAAAAATAAADRPPDLRLSPPPLPPPLPPPPPPPLLLCHLELHRCRLSPGLARGALPSLACLHSLVLRDVHTAPAHPSGWAWLGDCTALTRLALYGDCPLLPYRLGLAHPALSSLRRLRRLEAPAWSLPRDAPPNLAPLTALTALRVGGASSLPHDVPHVLPSVRHFSCACFFGGVPAAGHLAALLPGLTALHAVPYGDGGGDGGGGGWREADAEGEEAVERDWQDGCQDSFHVAEFLALPPLLLPRPHVNAWEQEWASGGGGSGGGGAGLRSRLQARGAADGDPQHAPPLLPYMPGGPPAPNAHSRVVTAVLPCDARTASVLHTYGSLRRLELVGGNAGALAEVAAPLRGVTRLSLLGAALPDSDSSSSEGGSSSEECSDDGEGGSAGGGELGNKHDSGGLGANRKRCSSGSSSDSDGCRQCGSDSGGGRHGIAGACERRDTRSRRSARRRRQEGLEWAACTARVLPDLQELKLEGVGGMHGRLGHAVLLALVLRLPRLCCLELAGMRRVRPRQLALLAAPRARGRAPARERDTVVVVAAAAAGGGMKRAAGDGGDGGGGGLQRLVLRACTGASEAACVAAVVTAARNVWVDVVWAP